jgi:hypothetical protein
VQLSVSPANRCIDVTIPLPPGATGGSVSIAGTSLAGRPVPLASRLVPVVRGLSAGKQAAIESDDPDAIVAAMLSGMSDACVVSKGCARLWDITATAAGRQAAVDAGAPIALVASLQCHPTDAAIAERACGAITSISMIDAGIDASLNAGASAAVVTCACILRVRRTLLLPATHT